MREKAVITSMTTIRTVRLLSSSPHSFSRVLLGNMKNKKCLEDTVFFLGSESGLSLFSHFCLILALLIVDAPWEHRQFLYFFELFFFSFRSFLSFAFLVVKLSINRPFEFCQRTLLLGRTMSRASWFLALTA